MAGIIKNDLSEPFLLPSDREVGARVEMEGTEMTCVQVSPPSSLFDSPDVVGVVASFLPLADRIAFLSKYPGQSDALKVMHAQYLEQGKTKLANLPVITADKYPVEYAQWFNLLKHCNELVSEIPDEARAAWVKLILRTLTNSRFYHFGDQNRPQPNVWGEAPLYKTALSMLSLEEQKFYIPEAQRRLLEMIKRVENPKLPSDAIYAKEVNGWRRQVFRFIRDDLTDKKILCLATSALIGSAVALIHYASQWKTWHSLGIDEGKASYVPLDFGQDWCMSQQGEHKFLSIIGGGSNLNTTSRACSSVLNFVAEQVYELARCAVVAKESHDARKASGYGFDNCSCRPGREIFSLMDYGHCFMDEVQTNGNGSYVISAWIVATLSLVACLVLISCFKDRIATSWFRRFTAPILLDKIAPKGFSLA